MSLSPHRMRLISAKCYSGAGAVTLAELHHTLSLSGHNISVEVSVIFPLLYQLRVDFLDKVKAKGLLGLY